jgi:hypothetical protein
VEKPSNRLYGRQIFLDRGQKKKYQISLDDSLRNTVIPVDEQDEYPHAVNGNKS